MMYVCHRLFPCFIHPQIPRKWPQAFKAVLYTSAMSLSPTPWAEFGLPLSVNLDNHSSSSDPHARGLTESLRLLPDDYVHIYLGRLIERPFTVILAVGMSGIISEAARVTGWLAG